MATKYIFVTGGVVSGLGKGITAASLGRLLKTRGLKVASQKLDPYINVDPGTMSPFQHGEVYVLNDGAETDLDLGHYERFVHCNLSRLNNLTSGQVFESVLHKERRGDYLGKTVQYIPHVTDEIKNRLYEVTEQSDVDIIITEIGGTVGDMEGHIFLEALRQFALECLLHPRHPAPLHQGRRGNENEAHPAIRRQAPGNRYSAGRDHLPDGIRYERRRKEENRHVLQRGSQKCHRLPRR